MDSLLGQHMVLDLPQPLLRNDEISTKTSCVMGVHAKSHLRTHLNRKYGIILSQF